MTQAQLKKKIKECISFDKKQIEKLIDKAILSGCMDIEGHENNYLLPKKLLSAIYKEMSRQYFPVSGQIKDKKDVENIYNHL